MIYEVQATCRLGRSVLPKDYYLTVEADDLEAATELANLRVDDLKEYPVAYVVVTPCFT